MRRHRLDALFLVRVYLGSKLSPSILEIVVVLRVPALCNVCSSRKICPSAKCASAANIDRDVDVFGAETFPLYHILKWSYIILKQ
jgi:hypothetical protein